VTAGEPIELCAGERITIVPGVFHSFVLLGGACIIGEVSTASDDLDDNIFSAEDVARFPTIEEDEPAQVHLIGERADADA